MKINLLQYRWVRSCFICCNSCSSSELFPRTASAQALFEKAVCEGNRRLVEACLRENSPSSPYRDPRFLASMLTATVRTGQVAICQLLLEEGAKPDAGFDCPLVEAAKKANAQIARLLLQYGANGGRAFRRSEEVPDRVQFLLECGANPNQFYDASSCDHWGEIVQPASYRGTTPLESLIDVQLLSFPSSDALWGALEKRLKNILQILEAPSLHIESVQKALEKMLKPPGDVAREAFFLEAKTLFLRFFYERVRPEVDAALKSSLPKELSTFVCEFFTE